MQRITTGARKIFERRFASEKSQETLTNRCFMFSSNNYNLLEFILFPADWLNKSKLNQKLRGKTILVTGASYGIGESLIYELAETGAHLILAARTLEKLLEIKMAVEARGATATVFAVDLTKPEQVENLLEELEKLPGGIDVFINNAGKSIRRSIYESLDRLHDFERTMRLNYFAPVQLMLGLIPILEKNKGHVINVSAANVLLQPAPLWAAYQASKTAFDQWFRAVAPELNARGVAASSVYLPLVRTRMIEPTVAYKNAPAMNPQHVARIICKLIVTRKRTYAPWWLIFGQLGSIVFRHPWESLAPRFTKNKDGQK